MTRRRLNEPINTFEEGDTVSGFALLVKKDLRQDKNGRDFLDLQLVDASGSIAAKAWSDSPALTADFDRHDFVAFKGSIHRYREQLQLNVKECRRVAETDRESGFDEARIIPSTREDIADLDSRLRQLLAENLQRPLMQRLAQETLQEYGEALRQHPAAKLIHHAYRGGLLEHVVSMAELALKICEHYRELDADLVLLGILFHDLGKIRELGAMPVNDYSVEGRLVGHVVLGRDLLLERCRAIEGFPEDLRLHLEHLVLSHQGRLEFGSPVRPMTPEALTLHFIDDLDSKLAQLRQARQSSEPPLQYLAGFGRYLYTGLEADESPGEADSEERSDDSQQTTQPSLEL